MEPSEEFLIPILQNMIKIPTENPDSITKELVEYISTLFPSEKGFRKKILTHTKNGVELHNIIVELGTGEKKIVLSGHLDTVPAGSKSNWKFDPFSGTINDRKVYGRGSADMKGGVVSIIGVLYNFIDNQEFLSKYTLVFAGTADEEAGMTGAEKLEKEGVMKDAVLLIVTEATNLQVGIAEKGVLWIKLISIGKQAHGSMPEQGINAIEVVANLLPQLHSAFSKELTSEVLGKSTLNVGTIVGGTKINVVPNETIVELDYRLIPEQNQQEVLEKLKNLKLEKGDYKIEVMQNAPALISKESSFITNLTKLTKKPSLGLSYGTDAAKLLVDKDIAFVIFGPGDNTIIHKDNEFVPIDDIINIAKFISEALKETYK